MDKTEAEQTLDMIDSLAEKLEEQLPYEDIKHRDEILDICSLLKTRAEMFFNDYGYIQS